MQCFALVNPSLEKLCRQEVKEILKEKSIADGQVIEFNAAPEKLLKFLLHSQSSRRIAISLGKHNSPEETDFSTPDMGWADLFPQKFSFKVEVENVKGMDRRIEIAKNVAGKLFHFLEKKSFQPSMELKKPDFLIVVYKTAEHYYLGLDLAGGELNSRHYRLFTHQASMKGDLAYFFVRTSGYKAGEKLLLGFVKDGTMAIEAALLTSKRPVHRVKDFSLQKCPGFREGGSLAEKQPPANSLFAFDDRYPNIVASRKNAALAGVADLISFQKYELDELDTRFDEGEFDRALFQVTAKDEAKLNEIFYQAHYVLKKKGILMLVSLKDLGTDDSDKFKAKKSGKILWGGSVYHYWIVEKK